MMLKGEPLTVRTLVHKFLRPISITWIVTLMETALMALVPLFIGFAIDGLLANESSALLVLTAVLAGLIVISVARRIYDTRAYGTIRLVLGEEQIRRSSGISVSRQNAQMGMGRELVDFLEETVPALMDSTVQLVVSLGILFIFDPALSYAALISAVLMIAIYGVFHSRFFRLNANYNRQTERQVRILAAGSSGKLRSHLKILRRIEVRLSDTEAGVYGAIFAVLIGFVLFNLWFAAGNLTLTAGTIFSIITYSWEFVAAALVLPTTLQEWSRLTEIMQRINRPQR